MCCIFFILPAFIFVLFVCLINRYVLMKCFWRLIICQSKSSSLVSKSTPNLLDAVDGSDANRWGYFFCGNCLVCLLPTHKNVWYSGPERGYKVGYDMDWNRIAWLVGQQWRQWWQADNISRGVINGKSCHHCALYFSPLSYIVIALSLIYLVLVIIIMVHLR